MPKSYSANSYGDKIDHYSKEELVELYIQENKTPGEAARLAEILYEELKLLNNRTRNVWRRARNR